MNSWLPDYIYTDGRFQSGLALVADEDGQYPIPMPGLIGRREY